MTTLYYISLVLLLISYSSILVAQEPKTLVIYHDSDYSNHHFSAAAMKMGALTALDEIDHTLQGYKVQLKPLDNRGNTHRSILNIKKFLADQHALYILGGMHSPPYIQYRDFINENRALLLIPWAAGAPATRYPSEQNWVFRLSIDDTKAGVKMVEFAQQTLQCKQPHMLLENTPWGKSNHKNMLIALAQTKSKVSWFSWNTKQHSAKIQLREIIDQQADCILFVGNAIEGVEFANAMDSLPKSQQIPIISHWGITGGAFTTYAADALANNLNLHFIQSCFSFSNPNNSELAWTVVARAKQLFPKPFSNLEKLRAPAGFIHAYDLTKLVISAINKIELTNDMPLNRAKLKSALEHLSEPIPGLLKTYQMPFSAWTEQNPDAHEALGLNDLCMAKFTSTGDISVLINE